MSGGNNNVASRVVRENTMRHFDKLPSSVRAAVANARFNWALAGWLKAFNRGELSARDLVAHVQRADKIETAITRFKAWGGDYPILPGEIAHIPLTKKARRR